MTDGQEGDGAGSAWHPGQRGRRGDLSRGVAHVIVHQQLVLVLGEPAGHRQRGEA